MNKFQHKEQPRHCLLKPCLKCAQATFQLSFDIYNIVGIGSMLIQQCEDEAVRWGYTEVRFSPKLFLNSILYLHHYMHA
jgi:hypothetical protein